MNYFRTTSRYYDHILNVYCSFKEAMHVWIRAPVIQRDLGMFAAGPLRSGVFFALCEMIQMRPHAG
jgi:hypothetical protein